MSMHWSVSRDATSNEAIAEMGQFLLNYPVHLFAECQAVNQIEDAATSHFVSTNNGAGTVSGLLTNSGGTTTNAGQLNGGATLDLGNHELLTNTSPDTIRGYLAHAMDAANNRAIAGFMTLALCTMRTRL